MKKKKKKMEQNLKWAVHLSRRLGAQGRGRWGGRQADAGADAGVLGAGRTRTLGEQAQGAGARHGAGAQGCS